MKKYIFAALVTLLLAGCENAEYNRGQITQRGHRIYARWNGEMQNLNFVINDKVFGLNKLLLASSQNEADSIYRNEFIVDECSIVSYSDAVYMIKSFGCMAQSKVLVFTDGKDLTVPGSAWRIILNLPDDFEYDPSLQKMSPSVVIEDNVSEIACGTPYLPMVVTCTAPGVWSWKDYDPEATTLNAFSIDFTVVEETYDVVPGLISCPRYRYTGKGLFSVIPDSRYLRCDVDVLSGDPADRHIVWSDGEARITVYDEETGDSIPVTVAFSPSQYSVTYSGVTEVY